MKLKLFPKFTIGRKVVMALTGLGLIGFLISHLMGNLLVYVGADAFNHYSEALISNPFIYVAEAGLLLLFIYHAVDAIMVKLESQKARPIEYGEKNSLGKSTLFSKTMMWTGIVILIFVVVHVATMKFGIGMRFVESEGPRDLYRDVAAVFTNPMWVAFYLFCLVCLGFHLVHALQSALRTIGLSQRRYVEAFKVISLVLAIVLTVGFSTIPLYFFLKGA